MRVAVTPLRKHGFRIPNRDLSANVELIGELLILNRWVSNTKTRLAAELRKGGSTVSGDSNLLAVLYEPVIKGWMGANFNLTGWEILDWKEEGRQIVVQEWACRIDGF